MSRTVFWYALLGSLVMGNTGAQVVESPTTVSKGEWLLEADVAAGVWDRSTIGGAAVSFREVVVAPVILSTGISDNLDVQFAFDGWIEAEVSGGGLKESVSGWGDVWVRAKWNFYGDEETGPAWALLPYVKIPVADSAIGNGEVEGGLALIYGQPIDEDDWIQAFVSGDSLHAEVRGRDEQLVAGAVWGRNLPGDVTVYTEVLVEWLSAESADLPVTWGIGISPLVAPGFALDFEVLAGITDEAPDWTAAIRLVWEL